MKLRTTIVLIIIVGVVVLGLWFGGDKKWEVLTSVATIGAVVAALFIDEIRGFIHNPAKKIEISDALVDRNASPGYFRGKVINSGNGRAKKARMKLITVIDGQGMTTNIARTLPTGTYTMVLTLFGDNFNPVVHQQKLEVANSLAASRILT